MSLPVHTAPSLDGAVVGGLVEVTGDEAHHAVAVRRLRTGEQVVLTDGRGTAVTGAVTSTGKRVFTVRIDDVREQQRPQPELVVVQALPKGERGELAVEMLTEVGVGVVVPWAAARCVTVWRGDRAEKSRTRWESTSREAAKQSRRTWFPDVAPLADTGEVERLVAGADLAVVLHESATQPLTTSQVPATGRVVLVVGPEGGLTDEEVDRLTAAGGRVVRLGDEVLRTSTAGVAAAAAVLSRTPRWR